MYFTTHLLAGCALGVVLDATKLGPGAAFVAGVALHAGLDCVPHHDYHRVRYGLLDAGLGVVMGITAAGLLHSTSVLAGGIGCAIPDAEIVYRQFRASTGHTKGKAVFPSHSGLLPHPSLRLPWGLLVQAGCVALSLLLVRAFR